MPARKIDLIEPFAWHDTSLTALYLKAPGGLLYMRHGEPRFSVVGPDGAYWVEKDDVVSAYVNALLTTDGITAVDGGDKILGAMSLADTIQVKETLFAFFTDARSAISRKSSTTSSSAS